MRTNHDEKTRKVAILFYITRAQNQKNYLGIKEY